MFDLLLEHDDHNRSENFTRQHYHNHHYLQDDISYIVHMQTGYLKNIHKSHCSFYISSPQIISVSYHFLLAFGHVTNCISQIILFISMHSINLINLLRKINFCLTVPLKVGNSNDSVKQRHFFPKHSMN